MNRNALIIGGTSGIGLEVATFLDNAGYEVVAAGRTRTSAIGVKVPKIDVTLEHSISSFFEALPFKNLDSLVYSAGVTAPKSKIENFSISEYQRVHDVNLLGAILTLKYAYPLLRKSNSKIVIVNSIAARSYSKFSGIEYTVSKAGLNGLVKQLAVEWGPDNILINSVFPSMVDTKMLRQNVDKKVLAQVQNTIPVGRIAQAGEIAASIEFLISDKNTYITGAGLDINGGQFLTA